LRKNPLKALGKIFLKSTSGIFRLFSFESNRQRVNDQTQVASVPEF